VAYLLPHQLLGICRPVLCLFTNLIYKCIVPLTVSLWALILDVQSLKRLSASRSFAPDSLTPWPGALPLDPAGDFAPDPCYRLALRARYIPPQPLNQIPPIDGKISKKRRFCDERGKAMRNVNNRSMIRVLWFTVNGGGNLFFYRKVRIVTLTYCRT